MRKLMPEALAACLALAAVSGQAMTAQGNEASADAYRTELKRQALFSRPEAGVSQGVVLAANTGSVQIAEIRTVRDPGSPEGAKVKHIADAKPAPGATVSVPEPGNWATALAGLLGVIAIARRRMSL